MPIDNGDMLPVNTTPQCHKATYVASRAQGHLTREYIYYLMNSDNIRVRNTIIMLSSIINIFHSGNIYNIVYIYIYISMKDINLL